MLTILPNALQFENEKSQITIQNNNAEQFVARVKPNNLTAYKCNQTEFVIRPQSQFVYDIFIETKRQININDEFRVQYFKDDQNKQFKKYCEDGYQFQEVILRVIQPERVNIKAGYEKMNLQQQILSAEDVLANKNLELNELQKQYSNIIQQQTLVSKQRKGIEQSLQRVEKDQIEMLKFNEIQTLKRSMSVENLLFLILLFIIGLILGKKL